MGDFFGKTTNKKKKKIMKDAFVKNVNLRFKN